MKYLDVHLSQPDRMLHPMQRFIREREVVRHEELVAWNVAGRESVEYELFYVEADRGPYREAIEGVESVRWYDLTPIDGDAFYVYICQETRAEDVRWREAFAALNLLVVPPIVYDANADFSMTVVGSGVDLQTMLDGLPQEISATVRTIGEYDARSAPIGGELTDRQLEALSAGADLGYFEVPREVGVEDVADELSCAPSTAATLLQKGQARVVRRLVERRGHRS